MTALFDACGAGFDMDLGVLGGLSALVVVLGGFGGVWGVVSVVLDGGADDLGGVGVVLRGGTRFDGTAGSGRVTACGLGGGAGLGCGGGCGCGGVGLDAFGGSAFSPYAACNAVMK